MIDNISGFKNKARPKVETRKLKELGGVVEKMSIYKKPSIKN